jgi:DNA-binding MarR family transcriptional regulator
MLMAADRERNGGRATPAATAAAGLPPGLNPMLGVKLWSNPCRLSFRANFIAHHFNQPIRAFIAREFRLSEPEYVVLYALRLRDGITAEDIAASTAKPKNTLSRGVNGLLRRRLIERAPDRADRRRMALSLTPAGRRIIDHIVPALLELEAAMYAPLSTAERHVLDALLERIILGAAGWPASVPAKSNKSKERSP